MFSQKVTVHYTDGTEKDIVLTQWSIGQFSQFAQSKGWKIDASDPGLMALVMLRYQAYCELHRDPTMPRPSFDRWDMTVSEVDPEDDESDGSVDPTETVTSVA